MNLIRRSAWAAVILGAVAGCTGDDSTNATSTAPASSMPPAPSQPNVPPPGGGTGAARDKEAASKEMQPPPGPSDAKKGDESPKLEPPKTEPGKGAGTGAASAVKLSDDEVAAIKQLPAGDQEAALKQAVCPVSGEHLGAMEKPVKVSAEGRTFFLCCENCQKEVKGDPKGVIAKLDAQAKR